MGAFGGLGTIDPGAYGIGSYGEEAEFEIEPFGDGIVRQVFYNDVVSQPIVYPITVRPVVSVMGDKVGIVTPK